MAEKINPRQLALEVLCDIDRKNAYSNILLRHRLKELADARDRAFVTELVYGVIQQQRYLDYVIDAFSKRKTKKMEYAVCNILRMGVYQILLLDRVPQSAAVNESVELAKRQKNRGSAAFVNGVLRSVCQRFDTIEWPKDPLQCLSVKTSFPFWMAGLFYKRIGRECDTLLPLLNQPPKLVLRANTLQMPREKLADQLKSEGITVSLSELAPDAVVCSGFSVGDHSLYKAGCFSVQDTAAQLSVCVLNPQRGDCVWDVCAAPGGKTCYIAEKMQDEGHIEAWDIYEHKKELIDAQAQRLSLHIIQTKVADAAQEDPHQLFDKILIDAPCSGLGIVMRKPEIKWNRKPEDVETFADLQYSILEHAASFLKEGGELVYSTCTITEQENENVVQKFLGKHSDFSMMDIQKLLPEAFGEDGQNGFITLWPHRHLTDGFFIAKMQKNVFKGEECENRY